MYEKQLVEIEVVEKTEVSSSLIPFQTTKGI